MPYQWLQDKDNPRVIQHLEAENNYCQQAMQDTEQLQAQLYHEMLSRIQETDLSVPYRWQDYEYYTKSIKGADYPQHWRRHIEQGTEQLLLDENLLAEQHEFFELAGFEVSPSQQLLAYAIDTSGDEVFNIHVVEIESATPIGPALENCSGNIVWSMDSEGFHYCTLDNKQRPWQLFSHRLKDHQSNNQLIFTEYDERFFLHAYRSKSDRHLIIESGSKTSSESWIGNIDTLDPDQLICVCPRRNEHEYSVDHHRDLFLIRSNREGINFSLYGAEKKELNESHWRLLVPHSADRMLEGVEPLGNYLVISERYQGQPKLHALSLVNHESFEIDFADDCRSLDCIDNIDPESQALRVRYESFTQPPSLWDINLASGQRTLLKQTPVLGEYNPEDYSSQRLLFRGRDGTQIPISLVGKNESFSAPAPLYLYAYGAYGDPLDPWFSHARLNLLERGFVFAIAHVRGGGCLGEDWYHQGRRLEKKHSFEDFIDCAQHLIAQGITQPRQLVISGGSAGGLLVGAVLNMVPQLFQCAIADVPFVDILATMNDPDLPLTLTEYDEWGDPNDAQTYNYIASYDPILNVTNQDYPHLLVTAGMEDSRVPYWEAAKWVATLRDRKTDNNLVLLRTQMGAGHGGVSGRYEAYREIAFEQAYILKSLKISR
ncbi:S9 family peptidase [Aestuariirhabdus sp. Z084]|nr:S9 family peptidase [Aestuariirhabdus haliotis]